jgi:hypothetical protein
MFSKVCINNAQIILTTSAVPSRYLEKHLYPKPFLKQCYSRYVLTMRRESWEAAPSHHITLCNINFQDHCWNNVFQGLCLQCAENYEY